MKNYNYNYNKLSVISTERLLNKLSNLKLRAWILSDDLEASKNKDQQTKTKDLIRLNSILISNINLELDHRNYEGETDRIYFQQLGGIEAYIRGQVNQEYYHEVE